MSCFVRHRGMETEMGGAGGGVERGRETEDIEQRER